MSNRLIDLILKMMKQIDNKFDVNNINIIISILFFIVSPL